MDILCYIGHPYNFNKMVTALTNHTFHVLNRNYMWNKSIGEIPVNVKLNAEIGEKYDIAISNNLQQTQEIKKAYSGKIIGLTHGYTEPEGFGGIPDAMVFQSKRIMETVDSPIKVYIPHYEPIKDIEYTGELSCIITVANKIADRPELMPMLYERITAGYIRVILGSVSNAIRGNIGNIQYPEIPYYLSHFRLMVYTAEWYCGMSHAVMEAMSVGCPVVINDFCDWSEYIDHAVNGFISNDVYELRYCIDRLVKDREYAIKIGQNGKKIIADYFNVDLFRERWGDLFERVL
jgi:hypothetical protein